MGRLLASLLVLILFAASCGGSENSDSGSASTDDANETEAAVDEPEASTEPVKIGVLTSLTGPFTPWGVHASAGMQLAADEINASGGIDGRMIELIVFDDQNSTEEAAAGLERMIEDGVVAVGGVISSGVGVNAALIAEEAGVPLFMTKGGSDAIITRDSRHTFRTCIPAAPSVAEPIAQFAQAEGITRIGAVIADYAWGRAMESAMQETFGAVAGLEFQIEVAPVQTDDFTTFLRSLEDFDPELLVATGHPPGSGAITAQSEDLGLAIPVTGAYTPFSLLAGGLGDTAIGVYTDFKCADFESDSYQDLARRYVAASGNGFMEDDAVSGYGIVTMVAAAVEAVGDDPGAIAEWLHTQTFDLPGYAFEMGWTEWGEMANAAPLTAVLGAGPAPEGTNLLGDWYPEVLNRPEPLTPYEPS